MATAAQILTWIGEAEAHRHDVATGGAVIDVWRDGRRIRKHISDIDELNAYIDRLNTEYAAAVASEAGSNRRRPISLRWAN